MRKVFVSVVDDLDGESPAAGTVTFGIDGVDYEIDLSEANAQEFRATLGKWTPFARKVRRPHRTAKRAAAQPKSAKSVREWARSNGHVVPDRGRIPTAVVDAYQRAVS